jgi:hypothetical protein
MARVADLSGNNPTDKSFDYPNRENAGEPNGSVTPQYAGEIILDTTNNTLWKAVDASNDSWVTLTTPF